MTGCASALSNRDSVSTKEFVTTADRPDLEDEAAASFRTSWPEFIFHDPVTNEYIERVGRYFERFDVLLLDDGRVSAGGWGVPLHWDGSIGGLPDGYDGSMVRSVEAHERSADVDCLSIMAIAVSADRRHAGLAGEVVIELRRRAEAAGLTRVIAPVRPALKARYPLTSMADFATWLRADGLHIDPWIRTHQRLGATVLAVAERSMVIVGSVSQWQEWTGMALPQSGTYVIPEALDVLEISYEDDRGIHVEPNLWMQHV